MPRSGRGRMRRSDMARYNIVDVLMPTGRQGGCVTGRGPAGPGGRRAATTGREGGSTGRETVLPGRDIPLGGRGADPANGITCRRGRDIDTAMVADPWAVEAPALTASRVEGPGASLWTRSTRSLPRPPPHRLQTTTHLWTLLVILLACYMAQVCAIECGPHEYTHNGDTCCLECEPGMGVVSPCNPHNNTVCQNCSLGQTFSGRWNHLDTCRTCTTCPDHSHMKTPCNLTHDTSCVCDRDYFMEQGAGRCRQCDLCKPGMGSIRACNGTHNTVCGVCPSGTFSDRWGRQGCVVCTYCGGSQIMLQMCSSKQDTVCIDIPDPAQFRTAAAVSLPPEEEQSRVTVSQGSNIIPVYCAILGLLVLGLVIYVVIAQRRRVALKAGKVTGSSPEQEGALLYHQREPGCVHPGSNTVAGKTDQPETSALATTLYKELSPLKQKEVEIMIDRSYDNQGGWRSLARQFGYLPREEDLLSKTESYKTSPARSLLSDWSGLPGATVGALSRALIAAGRHDVLQILHRGQQGDTHGQSHSDKRWLHPNQGRVNGGEARSVQDLNSSQSQRSSRGHRQSNTQDQNSVHRYTTSSPGPQVV